MRIGATKGKRNVRRYVLIARPRSAAEDAVDGSQPLREARAGTLAGPRRSASVVERDRGDGTRGLLAARAEKVDPGRHAPEELAECPSRRSTRKPPSLTLAVHEGPPRPRLRRCARSRTARESPFVRPSRPAQED